MALGDDGSPVGVRGSSVQGSSTAQHKRYKLLQKTESPGQDCVPTNEQNHTSNHSTSQVGISYVKLMQ